MCIRDSNRTVRVEEEDRAPDFEVRAPVNASEDVPALVVDEAAWRDTLVNVSAILEDSDVVYSSQVSLTAMREERTFVDTEGSHIRDGRRRARLYIQASAMADDGDEVGLFRALDVHDPSVLPSKDDLALWAGQMVADLEVLRAAPRVGSYTGPVILSGRATGVFFHEVMGLSLIHI